MDLRYRNRYRVPSARLPGWDYRWAGAYCFTICTRDRVCWLGEIVDGEMRPSPIGALVTEEWQRTPQVRPALALDAWILMPNHLHGILIFDHVATAAVETARWAVSSLPDETAQDHETAHRAVSTARAQETVRQETGSRLTSGSLGAVIGQFKAACTRRIWSEGWRDFAWQTRFYDQIIRDDETLNRFRRYIAENPLRWPQDKHHPDAPPVETPRRSVRTTGDPLDHSP